MMRNMLKCDKILHNCRTLQASGVKNLDCQLRRRSKIKRKYRSEEWLIPPIVKRKRDNHAEPQTKTTKKVNKFSAGNKKKRQLTRAEAARQFRQRFLRSPKTMSDDGSVLFKQNTQGRGNRVHIDYLPNELLQEIFLHVCQSEGDPAILKLSLACHRWERLVRDDIFRRRVHFSWLSTVYDWEKASDDFKSTYYVMYDIRECLECRRKYKDVPGFMGIGRGALRFYSNFADTGHPGYCSEYCAINSGTYVHPFDKLED